MKNNVQEWPAKRVVHLLGGCRICNEGPIARFEQCTIDNKDGQFQISEYGTLYHDIESIGCTIVGVDFYSHFH